MKTKNDQQLTQYAIPDGEGFTALPITFNIVIASGFALAMTKHER